MRSISTRFSIAVGLFAVVFSGFVFHQTWRSTRAQLEEAIARNKELALEFDLAIRQYVAESVQPEHDLLRLTVFGSTRSE